MKSLVAQAFQPVLDTRGRVSYIFLRTFQGSKQRLGFIRFYWPLTPDLTYPRLTPAARLSTNSSNRGKAPGRASNRRRSPETAVGM